MKKGEEMVVKMSDVPAIVVFFTFWFGRPKTNWKGIQREYHLSDEIVDRLKAENKAYRRSRLIVRGAKLDQDMVL